MLWLLLLLLKSLVSIISVVLQHEAWIFLRLWFPRSYFGCPGIITTLGIIGGKNNLSLLKMALLALKLILFSFFFYLYLTKKENLIWIKKSIFQEFPGQNSSSSKSSTKWKWQPYIHIKIGINAKPEIPIHLYLESTWKQR